MSVVVYFMWKSAEDRDPMLALALKGFYLFLVVIYLVVMAPLIGRWCL
jgi:type II secretory pathway component PulM